MTITNNSPQKNNAKINKQNETKQTKTPEQNFHSGGDGGGRRLERWQGKMLRQKIQPNGRKKNNIEKGIESSTENGLSNMFFSNV